MTDTIIPIAMIQAKARAAFDRGAGREDHGFNWHSVDAIATWQAEFDRCALHAGQQLAEAGSPP
jgi:hypothetical protein